MKSLTLILWGDLDSCFRPKNLIYLVFYDKPKSVYPHKYPNFNASELTLMSVGYIGPIRIAMQALWGFCLFF